MSLTCASGNAYKAVSDAWDPHAGELQDAQAAARQAAAAQSRLEAAEAEASGAVARLERKVALLTKERNVLKEIVASYDAEEANLSGVFNVGPIGEDTHTSLHRKLWSRSGYCASITKRATAFDAVLIYQQQILCMSRHEARACMCANHTKSARPDAAQMASRTNLRACLANMLCAVQLMQVRHLRRSGWIAWRPRMRAWRSR